MESVSGEFRHDYLQNFKPCMCAVRTVTSCHAQQALANVIRAALPPRPQWVEIQDDRQDAHVIIFIPKMDLCKDRELGRGTNIMVLSRGQRFNRFVSHKSGAPT